MKNYKKKYRDLEMEILAELRKKIAKSPYCSKHNGQPALKVTMLWDFEELCILHDNLTFIDNLGDEYNAINYEVELSDLIDILNK